MLKLLTSLGAGLAAPARALNAGADATAVIRNAYVYGYPVVDSYNVLYNYCLDPGSPEYKGPLNQVHHSRDVASPEDRAIIAPNVDTPYSHGWFDLRAEPIVLRIPRFAPNRYVSLQLIDLYSYILGYVTPRTNGNRGGNFLLAGPGWSGTTPPGVDGIFPSPTSLVLGLYRTQLLAPDDLAEVHRLQDGFEAVPLSRFLGTPAPAAVPPLVPIAPLDLRKQPLDPQFLRILDWMLRLMPVLPEEAALRASFAELGIGTPAGLTLPDTSPEIAAGMAQGLELIKARAGRVRSSAELFGSRQMLGADYVTRAAAAMLGIYGNAAEEFLGVGYLADADGRPFDGTNAYRITFAPGALPPVGAFWSITVYTAERLLYANPLKRYVINSPMLPSLLKGADGSITLYVQHASPGTALDPNWLPVPKGPFGLSFRTYLPDPSIRAGLWTAPAVRREVGVRSRSPAAPQDGGHRPSRGH
jgi:hypothetical protein